MSQSSWKTRGITGPGFRDRAVRRKSARLICLGVPPDRRCVTLGFPWRGGNLHKSPDSATLLSRDTVPRSKISFIPRWSIVPLGAAFPGLAREIYRSARGMTKFPSEEMNEGVYLAFNDSRDDDGDAGYDGAIFRIPSLV